MTQQERLNKARSNFQASISGTYFLSFVVTEVGANIKTEIHYNDTILSVGYSENFDCLNDNYIDSAIQAISNFDSSLVPK